MFQFTFLLTIIEYYARINISKSKFCVMDTVPHLGMFKTELFLT